MQRKRSEKCGNWCRQVRCDSGKPWRKISAGASFGPISTVSSSTPVARTTRRCSKSPVIIRSSLLHVRGRRWRDSPSLASRSVRSGIGGRFRHSGQRDIFFAVAGDEREFAVLPVLLGGVDAVARRADEVPPQVARGRKGFAAEDRKRVW